MCQEWRFRALEIRKELEERDFRNDEKRFDTLKKKKFKNIGKRGYNREYTLQKLENNLIVCKFFFLHIFYYYLK